MRATTGYQSPPHARIQKQKKGKEHAQSGVLIIWYLHLLRQIAQTRQPHVWPIQKLYLMCGCGAVLQPHPIPTPMVTNPLLPSLKAYELPITHLVIEGRTLEPYLKRDPALFKPPLEDLVFE